MLMLGDIGVEWAATIVAVALILFLAIVMIVGLFRYKVDEVLKLWAALGTIVGILTGTFGTYFFTRETTRAQLQAARQETDAVKTELSYYKGTDRDSADPNSIGFNGTPAPPHP